MAAETATSTSSLIRARAHAHTQREKGICYFEERSFGTSLSFSSLALLSSFLQRRLATHKSQREAERKYILALRKIRPLPSRHQ